MCSDPPGGCASEVATPVSKLSGSRSRPRPRTYARMHVWHWTEQKRRICDEVQFAVIQCCCTADMSNFSKFVCVGGRLPEDGDVGSSAFVFSMFEKRECGRRQMEGSVCGGERHQRREDDLSEASREASTDGSVGRKAVGVE